MIQIKTIADTIHNAEQFDEAVNASIAEGWTLVKRYYTRDRFFIAELEREIITETERTCENCMHCMKDPNEEPCCHCNDGTLEGWEPING